MRYLRLHTLGFAALLVALTVIHCAPTEAQADRRRRWTTYGSDRGRLVVACDMRSDTCSDGRKITTTRPTPVPCEVAPGQWEMVPENTGCYSVRGLEAWAANTSYLAYGADLTNTAWIKQTGMSVEKVGSVYRIRRNRGDTGAAFVHQEIAAVTQQETWTAACVMRAGTATVARFSVHRSSAAAFVDLTSEWQVFANTKTLEAGQIPGVSIGPAFTAEDSYIEVAGCWLTRTATPGRACWGGEAPVTCARDFHRMPATGFPVTTGEISWVMSLERMPDGSETLRGIVWADGAPIPNRISLTGSGGIRVYTGETAYVTGPLSWEPGRLYSFRLIMAEDEWKVFRDGVLVGSTPPLGSMDWRSTVRLGDLLDGSIRSLTVRSYEEVSP